MNYLAHAYLSFANSEVLAGNMISDYVKGKKQYDYPPGIQQGIALHRMIDTYTDKHPATKSAIAVFKPVVGAYAGAFIDVVYDHFLATDAREFPGNTLAGFSAGVYRMLNNQQPLLPERFLKVLPYMVSQDWLLNYRTKTGIRNSFGGLFRRAKYLAYTDDAFAQFEAGYSTLKDCYDGFFPHVKAFALVQYKTLTGYTGK